jgi:hypothetical protein
MQNYIGLWVDHRKAVIILHSKAGEEIKVIQSEAERHPGRIDGEQSKEAFEALNVPADDVKDRKFGHQLNHYYDEVIACIHGADSLLILGPGEARVELGKRLAQQRPSHRKVEIEAADKMTDRQIAAQVREHFKVESLVVALPAPGA